MKKYIQNIWVRLIACLLCTVSVLGLVFGIVGTIFFMKYPFQKNLLDSGNEKLMTNYALYALDNLKTLENDTILEDTNLYITIEKVQNKEDSEQNPTVSIVYSNMPEGITPTYFIGSIYETTLKYYSLDSLAQAMDANYWPSSLDYMELVAIDDYVFDVNTGLFYYHTAKGYFKANYIYVSENGMSYDYNLTSKDGKQVYYNSYYDYTLNTENYRNWDWVKMSAKKMGVISEYYGAKLQLIQDSSTIEENLCGADYYVENYHVYYVSDTVPYYRASMAVAKQMEKQDLFVEYANWLDLIYGYQRIISVINVCSILGIIVGIVLLAVSAPREKDKLQFFHRIPVLFFTGMIAALELLFVWGTEAFIHLMSSLEGQEVNFMNYVMPLVLVAAVMIFIAFVYLANIITRIKTKVFFRYSELYYISRPVVYLWGVAKENLSLFWKGVLVLAAVSMVELILFVANMHEPDNLLVLFYIGKIVEAALILYVLLQMKMLKDGAKRIASGNLNQKIPTDKMRWVFKEHAEDINRVADGIEIAVEEQMKSERFKTELITNVSHDIKTPLTSIINYVDLMKKEELTDPTMLEYVDVLDRQSARLKKLIEDLMEASKASTGNLDVNLEECDMGVLLTQLVGEFGDKLSANGLEAVVSKPEEPVMIMADGRHIWRVLDNLMNNICKYSQENTRVYVSLEENEKDVQIVFKNISKVALNIPSDQLMQRFVRGDSSRHTEGSGLGLSIARSLTELMNGTLRLDIDGDLFKVTLKFNRIG